MNNKEVDRTQLTPRESQIWELRHQGLTVAKIAEQLDVEDSTIKAHFSSIKTRMRARKEQANG
jgi:DNA-binding NarL/FixJ family response regulator